MNKIGFKEELGQVRFVDIDAVRKELSTILGIGDNNRTSLPKYIKGILIPRLDKAIEIKKVFKKYGVDLKLEE